MRGGARVYGHFVEATWAPSLTNLDGLGSLVSIGRGPWGGELAIDPNESLTKLDLLSALRVLAGDLTIRDNTGLPTCEATALETRLSAAEWAAESVISGNDDAGSCE